jgi:SRSO17 transposase
MGCRGGLCTADWNADAVRDELRSIEVERLGLGGILIVDETGFVKKGTRSAGVSRQYTGTIGNWQIGVFCAYATPTGRALIDGDLHLPRAWTDDRERARAAGIDDAVPLATKPEPARRMLTQALDAGVLAGWLTADEDLRAGQAGCGCGVSSADCPTCWPPAATTRWPPSTGASGGSAP